MLPFTTLPMFLSATKYGNLMDLKTSPCVSVIHQFPAWPQPFRSLVAGTFEGEDWTAEARSRISARMLQYQDMLNFSLLALCRSPFQSLRRELASNVQRVSVLGRQQAAKSSEWQKLTDAADNGLLDDSKLDALAEYSLALEDLSKVEIPQSFIDEIEKPSFGTSDAIDLRQTLDDEQRRIKSEFMVELNAWNEDETRVEGRRNDYTPALHGWVRKLAEKGVLADLVGDVNGRV